MHHILVVEDDPDVCELLRMGLEFEDGYHVTKVMNVSDARGVLARESGDLPDAALIDVVLPDGSGLGLARHVIDLGIPVLLTTAHLGVRDQLEVAGCPVLPKPFRFEALITEMRMLLNATQERKAELVASLERLSRTSQALGDAAEESARLVGEARCLVECPKAGND